MPMPSAPAPQEFSPMVKGAKALQRRLDKIPMDVRAAAATEALLAALGLSEAMKQVVPVDEGDVKASIRVERGKRGDRFYVKAGGPTTTKAVREGYDSSFDYATASEWGTKKQPAKPWFYPTWRRNKKQIRAGLEHEIKKAVRKSNG
ncbi:HK97-gp10 family putative phage morphogenesis protein [Bosea sp. NPDC055594]